MISIQTRFTLFGRRCAAMFYDAILVMCLWLIATWPWVSYYRGAVPPEHYGYRLYLLGLTTAYYVGFWVFRGQTTGMLAWKLQLQKPIRTWSGICRLLWACLTNLPAGLGLWWALFDPQGHTLYDRLSGTYLHQGRQAP